MGERQQRRGMGAHRSIRKREGRQSQRRYGDGCKVYPVSAIRGAETITAGGRGCWLADRGAAWLAVGWLAARGAL